MNLKDAMAMHERLIAAHGEYQKWTTELKSSESVALTRDLIKAVRTVKAEPKYTVFAMFKAARENPDTASKVLATVLTFFVETTTTARGAAVNRDEMAAKIAKHLRGLIEEVEEQPEVKEARVKEQVAEHLAKKPRTKVRLSPDLDKVAKATREANGKAAPWVPSTADKAIIRNVADTLSTTPAEAIDGQVGNPLRGYLLDIRGAYIDGDPVTAHKIIQHMTESNYAPAGEWARYIVAEYIVS